MIGGQIAGVALTPLLLLWFARLGLLAVLAAICWSDIRSRRIPNRLVLGGLGLALAWHAFGVPGSGLFHGANPGGLGIGLPLAGAAAAFGGFLLLYAIRMMGAGDVKLMGLLGAVFGLHALPGLVLAVFATGGALVAVRLLDGARRKAVLENLRTILFAAFSSSAGTPGPRFDPRTDTADPLPFAVAIVGGAVVFAGLQLTGVAAR